MGERGRKGGEGDVSTAFTRRQLGGEEGTLTARRGRLEGGNVAADKATKALKLVREVARTEVGVEAGDVENAVERVSYRRFGGLSGGRVPRSRRPLDMTHVLFCGELVSCVLVFAMVSSPFWRWMAGMRVGQVGEGNGKAWSGG